MSQPINNKYQAYSDPHVSMKYIPPVVNGQTSATQHLQNGIQAQNTNVTGTPSSQSSRNPSRETSRDPSPTQYFHTPYRPQLNRPPMPPINGSQTLNQNPANFPSHVVPTSGPVLTSPTSVDTINPLATTVNKPETLLNYRQSLTSSQSTDSLSSNTNQGNVTNLQLNAETGFNQSLPPMSSESFAPINASSNASSQNYTNQSTAQGQIPRVQPTVPIHGQFNSPSYDSVRRSQYSEQKQTSLPLNNIVDQNASRFVSSTNNPPYTVTQSQSNAQSPMTTVPRSQSQNFGSSQSYSQGQQSVKYGGSQNLFGSAQNVQSGPQNPNLSNQQSLSNSHLNQYYTPNQDPSTLKSASSPQIHYPLQQKSQHSYLAQPPPQQPSLTTRPNLPPPGPNVQQSSAGVSNQYFPLSQTNYPPNLYESKLSSNTASNSTLPKSAIISTAGQLRSPPITSGIPPLPGQQMYESRAAYPSQMSNIPLDNMPKRYPATYQEQMSQLNNQMSGMAVTQSGFNKLWGMETVDLLQCRNVLPAEKVEPPKIHLHQEFFDRVNCSSDIFRCTLTKIPESNSLLQKSRLPLGVLIHPFRDLMHLPVVQCSTIVRCRVCRTYINPFVYFVDAKRWKCNLCYRINELPGEFQFDPVSKSYGDPSRRPEVKTCTIEFLAPTEYMLRPPPPAIYLFVFDVSRLAVESGYLTVVCNTIAEELTRLPGDSRTQVGFLAVDSAIHFFNMPDNVSQPHEMIMLDVDDVFLPCPDNLIVNLKEREELLRDLLAQLPIKFQGTHDTNSALGAALQVAVKLMSPTGGRVTVFQTCLPNLGPGALQSREDPNTRASKDVPHLNPATDFYKRLALDCSGQQIAMDLFLLNCQYSDLATLSGISKFSGGCMYHMPLFRISKPQHAETLDRMLRRYLTRKIGFEAVIRVRCTRGLSIHTFHGNFFVRSTDLLSLPNINPDAGFGMQVTIEENLSDAQNVCFQAALLYTSSKGERRIRVHTLCLPVATSLPEILHSADQQCIIGLLAKMAVDKSQQSSLSDARDALINAAIDVLSAYKMSQSSYSGGLSAPSNLKLLPLYILALLKNVAFRSGTNTRLDDRVFAMCQLKTLPLYQLMQTIYPDLYPIHMLDDKNMKEIDGKVCPQPPRLHLSAEKIDSQGAYLLDACDKIFIYVGKNIHPTFCNNVLGVSTFTAIPEEMYELPELPTLESERLRNFVFSLQEEKPYHASLQIIRDDSHFRTLFTERLIEDRFESSLSYHEFLQHLKTQLK